MAVTLTPNIGLAKPTESEIANNWTNVTKLAEDNNLILMDKLEVDLIPYTPTVVGSTTNPNVGAGAIAGEYCEVQGFIWGSFTVFFLLPGIVVGSGAGAYGISLPTALDATFHSVGTTLSDQPGVASCIGEANFIDNTVALGGTAALDAVAVAGTTYARIILETFVGKTSAYFTPNMPYTVDTNDRWSGQFFYKKA
jgi:hypothetical protein